MKRHLETCRAATELARTALQACADILSEISSVLEDLSNISESLHLSLASSPGWPEPSADDTAALREATARLATNLRRAFDLFNLFNSLATRAQSLVAEIDTD